MPLLSNFLVRIRGGDPLPPGVRFDLDKGERVLTWGRIYGGGFAAATDFALRTTASDTTPAATHLWHEIARASWADGHLTVEAMDGAVVAYRMAEPRGLPVAVRELVNVTVVVSEQHTLAGTPVRVVARRDLRSSRLVWSAIASGPVADADVHELIEAVRRRIGG